MSPKHQNPNKWAKRPGQLGTRYTPAPVPGEGPAPATIMLIGERPGREEAYSLTPRPFIGLAGKYLNITLDRVGLKREEIYVTNLVKTYSDYGKPTAEEIGRDADELAAEILAVRPSIIGLLGTFAVEFMLSKEKASLERTHGIATRIGGQRGNTVYLPMFHPATIIYDVSAWPHVLRDFEELARLQRELVDTQQLQLREDNWAGREMYNEYCADRGKDKRTAAQYGTDNVTAAQGRPRENGQREDGATGQDTAHSAVITPYRVVTPCAIDTEGSGKHPWCATTSIYPGASTLTRGTAALDVTESPVIYLHNSLHDLAVLRALGVAIGDDQFRDTMVWAYLLAREPQGLKDLAYRRAGMEMSSYPEVIAEADRNLALAYLEGVDACEWPKAEPYVVIEAGQAKIKKPQGINQRVRRILNDCGRLGEKVDPRKRWDTVADYVKSPVVEELGEMPEATLDDVPRDKANKYACRDSDATIRIAPGLEREINEMGLDRVSEIDHGIMPMVDRMQTVGWKLAPVKFWDELEARCEKQMYMAVHEIQKETGWVINPDSGNQVAELIYGKVEDGGLGIKPDRMTDSGERGATNDKALEAIASQSPVIDHVFDYREASKVKSSFVGPLRKACQTGDGRYRYQLRVTRVTSGRLAGAGKPNLLAIPVRTDLGKVVRAGFTVDSGRVLGDWDLDQVEMRQLAHESRDAQLVGIFNDGSKDIHRETAARMFGIKPADVITPQRYAAKRVGFGVITGITGHGLVDQMSLARAKRPDGENWTEDDCNLMIEEWFKMYPGARSFMEKCRDEARATGMIRDCWGRLRYLPGVWSPMRHVREEAERQSHSHVIQGGAQGLLKRAMKVIWNEVCKCQWMETEPLIQVHDELILEVPEDPAIMQLVNDLVVGTMTTVTKLIVPVKAKGGYAYNWAEAKD